MNKRFRLFVDLDEAMLPMICLQRLDDERDILVVLNKKGLIDQATLLGWFLSDMIDPRQETARFKCLKEHITSSLTGEIARCIQMEPEKRSEWTSSIEDFEF